VLHNLISNAVKFTGHGSIGVVFSHSPSGLALRVEDSGIGIAADKLGAVFEKFVQADASTTRRFGGSGLGLTICRDLVALMGGEIMVESVEGSSTTFTVNLPLERMERPSKTPDAAPCVGAAPGAGALRVLAAEDNRINQIVLKTLLDEVGVEVTIVGNGQEALDAWREGRWDLVLMDIQMPVMDGITAVRSIREIERVESRVRTPVIAVTANAMAHQEGAYRAAGMDAMVAKPIDLASLLGAMDSVITPDEEESSLVARL
jgi:CheY-like chemotaxis protein